MAPEVLQDDHTCTVHYVRSYLAIFTLPTTLTHLRVHYPIGGCKPVTSHPIINTAPFMFPKTLNSSTDSVISIRTPGFQPCRPPECYQRKLDRRVQLVATWNSQMSVA